MRHRQFSEVSGRIKAHSVFIIAFALVVQDVHGVDALLNEFFYFTVEAVFALGEICDVAEVLLLLLVLVLLGMHEEAKFFVDEVVTLFTGLRVLLVVVIAASYYWDMMNRILEDLSEFYIPKQFILITILTFPVKLFKTISLLLNKG